ncbi:monocarboxylate transporter 9-like isoform X2 [Uloborus diversus]|uniref:monocarboxylate transporter 9-like isoform X2 n=1 Tax=Uloborus diversus TaxID=327109 RepID=UPI00240A5F90|nr:monocarboxylate transporter 9-like isoform X2 [Uloborus diversus]XP_054706384.1 monocarboxylate transporter 9-like isoform X2 [Uloborus diversus]
MKCLAHKRSASIDRIRQNLNRTMGPARQAALHETSEDKPLMEPPSPSPRRRRCRLHGTDSVWSWVVAIANFSVCFIIVGLGRMSGVLYVDFMNIFHIGRKSASMPFSIQQAARNLFGPLAGVLGQKYGVRVVTLVGGIIGAVSAITCFFIADMLWITIMWGLFFGISTAFTTTLNQVSIDQHFDKHRATAGGLAFSGGCVGAFLFPAVIELLMSLYGITGTFLVMGGIILNVIPASMLLGEPKPDINEKDDTTDQTAAKTKYGSLETTVASNTIDVSGVKDPETGLKNTKPSTEESINFCVLRENNGFVLRLLSLDPLEKAFSKDSRENTLLLVDKIRMLDELEEVYAAAENRQRSLPRSSSLTESSAENTQDNLQNNSSYSSLDLVKKRLSSKRGSKKFYETPRKQFIKNKLKELCAKDDLRFNSYFQEENQSQILRVLQELKKLNEVLSNKDIFESSGDSSVSFECYDSEEGKYPMKRYLSRKKKNINKGDPEALQGYLMTALKLHANPIFLLICLCRGVFMLTFIPLVTVVVDFAMDKGLPQADGKYMIALLSIGDFLGRLCLGWITDTGCLSLPRYMLVMMMLLGGSTASLPHTDSRATMMMAILLFGILNGSLFVHHPLLVSKYMKSHEKVIAMGFINFLSGFLGLALPAFIGYFRDHLGSYDQMFYLNGAICCGVGFMWILEPLFIKFLPPESSPYDGFIYPRKK